MAGALTDKVAIVTGRFARHWEGGGNGTCPGRR